MSGAKGAFRSAAIAGVATALLGAGAYVVAPSQSRHIVADAAHVFSNSSGTPASRSMNGSGDVGAQSSQQVQLPRSVDNAVMPAGGQPSALSRVCPPDMRLPTTSALESGLLALSQSASHWTWADGGISVLLGDGRVAWFFGDTLSQSLNGKTNMTGNSMAISSGSCFATVQVQGDTVALPNRPGSLGVTPTITWPTSVAITRHSSWDDVKVIGVRVHRNGGFWGFTLLGSTLTEFAVPHGGAPVRLQNYSLTEDDDSAEHITWGAAALQSGTTIYLYGTARIGGDFGRQLYVAKTDFAGLGDQSGWIYWNGSGWGGLDQIAPSLKASSGVSQTVSVFAHGGNYYLVSKVGGDFGTQVGLWKSASPMGPWAVTKTLNRPYSLGNGSMQYLPLAHPELSPPGQLTISMSRNSTRPGVTNKLLPTFFMVPIG